jgi:tetratricopeptide (TPR) repeat protein
VRKIQERLRITAQLIEVSTGAHLWAEKYDTGLEDVFAIQDQLTQTVAATLVGRVARSGAEKARRKPTEFWAAYECYLMAQEHCDRYEIDQAIALLRRAVDLDAEYAQAYAMLADCYATQYFFDGDEQNLKAALPFAQRALSIDDNDGLSHYAMGYIHLYYHRFDAAGPCLAKAVSLNPNSVLFASHHALWLSRVGRVREALETLDFVALRDPLQQPYYYQIRAIALFAEGRYEEALHTMHQASSHQYYDHALMAAANAHLGNEQAAGVEAAEVARRRPGTTIPWLLKITPFKHRADRDRLATGLQKAGLPE